MQASSEKGNAVTTVLVPSQLQDKNNGQAPHRKKSNHPIRYGNFNCKNPRKRIRAAASSKMSV